MLYKEHAMNFFHKGDLSLLNNPVVGIVGSRICDNRYIEFAHHATLACMSKGFTIASGLAIGIDTAVHGASFKTPSVCCLPVNVDSCYPSANLNLKEAILKGKGLCISVNQKNKPEKHDFLLRNKLLVSVSSIVVVINAERYSGTINTANEAIKQAKKLFVLDNPSSGNRYLIDKKNAISFRSIEDLLIKLDA